jgi:hypothetical protein
MKSEILKAIKAQEAIEYLVKYFGLNYIDFFLVLRDTAKKELKEIKVN